MKIVLCTCGFCACVCEYVCVCVRMSKYSAVRIYLRVSFDVDAFMSTCVCTFRVCVYVRTLYAYMCVYIRMCMLRCTCACVSEVCTCIHACVWWRQSDRERSGEEWHFKRMLMVCMCMCM